MWSEERERRTKVWSLGVARNMLVILTNNCNGVMKVWLEDVQEEMGSEELFFKIGIRETRL